MVGQCCVDLKQIRSELHQMEVSLRVVVCFLFCVLVCGVRSTAAVVDIAHNGNFDSGLVLRCTNTDGFTLPNGVSFQRNEMDLEGGGSGTLSYPLNQSNEGNFTCKRGVEMSQPITLAGI